MDDRRRTFLKSLGIAALGIGGGAPLLRAAGKALDDNESDDAVAGKQWAMVIDLRKCRNEAVRRACVEACRRAHNVPKIPDEKHRAQFAGISSGQH